MANIASTRHWAATQVPGRQNHTNHQNAQQSINIQEISCKFMLPNVKTFLSAEYWIKCNCAQKSVGYYLK